MFYVSLCWPENLKLWRVFFSLNSWGFTVYTDKQQWWVSCRRSVSDERDSGPLSLNRLLNGVEEAKVKALSGLAGGPSVQLEYISDGERSEITRFSSLFLNLLVFLAFSYSQMFDES